MILNESRDAEAVWRSGGPAEARAHFIPSGTRPAQVFLDKCFLHDASISPNREMAKANAVWPSGQVRALRTES